MNLDTGLVVSQREIRQFNLGNARLVAKARDEPKRGPEQRAHGRICLSPSNLRSPYGPMKAPDFTLRRRPSEEIDDSIHLCFLEKKPRKPPDLAQKGRIPRETRNDRTVRDRGKPNHARSRA
jgi:hypothetical protein